MDPECHPEVSKARSEEELKAEQDAFFLSNSSASGNNCCVQLLGNEKCKASFVPVLSEVVERDSLPSSEKPAFKLPNCKPLTPKIILNSHPKPKLNDQEAGSIEELMASVSRENDEKLAKMSESEIEALKAEIFESVPESFLNKLRH